MHAFIQDLLVAVGTVVLFFVTNKFRPFLQKAEQFATKHPDAVHYVLIALHSLGVSIENLTPIQKVMISKFVTSHLPEVTPTEMDKVFAEAQKLAKEFDNLDIVKAAKILEPTPVATPSK